MARIPQRNLNKVANKRKYNGDPWVGLAQVFHGCRWLGVSRRLLESVSFRLRSLGLGVSGLGFRVWALGFGVWGLGFG